ncbi:MAG: hypothetical protein H6643_08770 [Caldilineaceae bacterium]|nr:hypothetical protein [Caldilineaceae bacterium]
MLRRSADAEVDGGELASEILDENSDRMRQYFWTTRGGFGSQPKFCSP